MTEPDTILGINPREEFRAKDALTYLADQGGMGPVAPTDLFDLVLPVCWGISNDNLNILCRATIRQLSACHGINYESNKYKTMDYGKTPEDPNRS